MSIRALQAARRMPHPVQTSSKHTQPSVSTSSAPHPLRNFFQAIARRIWGRPAEASATSLQSRTVSNGSASTRSGSTSAPAGSGSSRSFVSESIETQAQAAQRLGLPQGFEALGAPSEVRNITSFTQGSQVLEFLNHASVADRNRFLAFANQNMTAENLYGWIAIEKLKASSGPESAVLAKSMLSAFGGKNAPLPLNISGSKRTGFENALQAIAQGADLSPHKSALHSTQKELNHESSLAGIFGQFLSSQLK